MTGIFYLGDNAFFLECTDGLSTDFHRNFLAVNFKCFLLKIRLPYLLGVALREADIAAKLLALAGDFAFLHVNPFNSVCTYLAGTFKHKV